MAVLKPTAGKFSVEGSAMSHVVDMTLSIDIGTGDITPIGVSWNQVLELQKGWSIAVVCNYDPTSSGQAAAVTGFTTGDATFTSINFYEDASTSLAGSAILTSATITKSVGSPDKLNLSYTGNAALARS